MLNYLLDQSSSTLVNFSWILLILVLPFFSIAFFGILVTCRLLVFEKNHKKALKFSIVLAFMFVFFGGFLKVASFEDQLAEYSKHQLKTAYLDIYLNLYKLPENDTEVPQVAKGVKLIRPKQPKVFLGKVDCGDKAFIECVRRIKENKEQIIASLEANLPKKYK